MQPELIKKTFKQRTKTNMIGDNEIEIIPDLDVVYSTKVLLKKRDVDLGFFDPFEITDSDSTITGELTGDDVILDQI